MIVIEIRGDIIHDDDQWFYDWLDWAGTSPNKVKNALASARGGPVEAVVNSFGGSVYAGSEIYTMLREHPGEVTVKIPGIAASAASVIAMGADKVIISPTAQIMIHNASTVTDGDNRDHTQVAEFLSNVNQSIANAYVDKTGLPLEEVLELMDAETFFTAQQAKDKGFADEIMFEDQTVNGVELAASAAAHSVPQAMVKRMRELAAKGQLPPQMKTQPAPEAKKNDDVKGHESKSKKEESKIMNKEEFKAQHPNVFNEIVEEVKNAERTRISGLNALASHPGAKEIVEAAIASGEDQGAVAVKILQASAERLEKVGADREKDSKNSGADKVPADAPPLVDKTEEEVKAQKAAEASAAHVAEINRKRGHQ